MNPSQPSKQFLIRGAVAIGLLAIILVVQTNWFKNLFHKKSGVAVNPNATVGEVIEKDSNGNGIPDWEERLWGLDPTALYTGDLSNREIIEQKRKTLGGGNAENEKLNETDRVAREAFSIATALSQQGKTSSEGLQAIGSNLGSSINVKQITDHFSLKNIKVIPTSTQSLKTYHAKMSDLIAKYENNLARTDTIMEAIGNNDFSGVGDADQLASTYKEIALQMATLPVPVAVAKYHLDIINSLYGEAEAFGYLKQFQDDGMIGLAGAGAYRTYDLQFSYAIQALSDYLQTYGII